MGRKKADVDNQASSTAPPLKASAARAFVRGRLQGMREKRAGAAGRPRPIVKVDGIGTDITPGQAEDRYWLRVAPDSQFFRRTLPVSGSVASSGRVGARIREQAARRSSEPAGRRFPRIEKVGDEYFQAVGAPEGGNGHGFIRGQLRAVRRASGPSGRLPFPAECRVVP